MFANNADDGFCEAYFAEPDDVAAAFQALVARLSLRSVRGLAAYYGDPLRGLRDEQPARFDEVVAHTERTCERPEIVATCWHALYLGRVPNA